MLLSYVNLVSFWIFLFDNQIPIFISLELVTYEMLLWSTFVDINIKSERPIRVFFGVLKLKLCPVLPIKSVTDNLIMWLFSLQKAAVSFWFFYTHFLWCRTSQDPSTISKLFCHFKFRTIHNGLNYIYFVLLFAFLFVVIY